MISTLGGEVWQWDLGRRVEVTEAADSQVHFARKGSTTDAVAVEAKALCDGRIVADIPNFLLQDGSDLEAWVWRSNRTQEYLPIKVKKRNRPPNYIYEPTKIVTFEELTKEVRDRLDAFGEELEHIDYNQLENLPTIEGVEVKGDLLMKDFGADTVVSPMSDDDIDEMFD